MTFTNQPLEHPVPNIEELRERYDKLENIDVYGGITYKFEWKVSDGGVLGAVYECAEEAFRPRKTKVLVDSKLGPAAMLKVVRITRYGVWVRPKGYPEMEKQDVERWGPKQFLSHDDILKGLETETLRLYKDD